VTDHLPLLAAEVDRQLAEISTQASGVADRVGVLVAVGSLAVGFLQVAGDKVGLAESVPTIVCLAFSLVLGFAALTPRMSTGPSVSALAGWRQMPHTSASNRIYWAKVVTLRANRRRLALMRSILYSQALAIVTATATATILLVRAGRLPGG
jgi:hypothetical protein